MILLVSPVTHETESVKITHKKVNQGKKGKAIPVTGHEGP
jgi:hypothetical protein